MSVGAVAGAFVGDEVRDASERDGGREEIRVAHDPVRHEAAVAAASDTEPRRVDPGVATQHFSDAVHDVDVVLTAPFIHDAALKLSSVAGRPSWIGEEDGPSLRRVYLELVEPVDAVHAGRSAMNTEN